MRQILLQNATEVYYKMRQVFYYKRDDFITKCDSYYKMRQFYYKIRQLLQNATFITNCDSTMFETSKDHEFTCKPNNKKMQDRYCHINPLNASVALI